MGYDFKSPAAQQLFRSLPLLDADPSFLAVAAKGTEAVHDWFRNLARQIDNAITNMRFEVNARGRFDTAKQTSKRRPPFTMAWRQGVVIQRIWPQM